jgi:hypothetical protein
MTFEDLCLIEPRLKDLELEIKYVKDDEQKPYFCANSLWYRTGRLDPSFRKRMSALVGWQAENSRLRNSEAYAVAYDHLYFLLPNCRNCSCS